MSLALILGLVLAALLGLLLILLLQQRRTAAGVEALNAAREADRSSLMLQQQIDGLRSELGRSLDASTQSLNQQLAQMLTAVNQRLHQNAELMQQTQRALGERLDSTAQVVGAVQRSLGGLEEASRKIYEIGKDIASLQQILRAPKLRGGLGELLLEDLLAQILPADHFVAQYTFRNGQKVDAVIKLGNRPGARRLQVPAGELPPAARCADAKTTARACGGHSSPMSSGTSTRWRRNTSCPTRARSTSR